MPGPHEKRGFKGFCLDEFEDACITGAHTCPDWERCYSTLSDLEERNKETIDLRKAAREAWPVLFNPLTDTLITNIMAGDK